MRDNILEGHIISNGTLLTEQNQKNKNIPKKV